MKYNHGEDTSARTSQKICFQIQFCTVSQGGHCQVCIKFSDFSRYFNLHQSRCTDRLLRYQNKSKHKAVDEMMSLTVLFVLSSLSGTPSTILKVSISALQHTGKNTFSLKNCQTFPSFSGWWPPWVSLNTQTCPFNDHFPHKPMLVSCTLESCGQTATY